LLTDGEKIQHRWKEYRHIEDLCDIKGKPKNEEVLLESNVSEDYKGPELLYNEFEKPFSEVKNGKSEGIDNIPAELLKALGLKEKYELFKTCSEVYLQGEWPNDFLESVLIPIEKKCGAEECVDFRTISLSQHASKILLKILTNHLESKAESFQ